VCLNDLHGEPIVNLQLCTQGGMLSQTLGATSISCGANIQTQNVSLHGSFSRDQKNSALASLFNEVYYH
jgi:hypothetical protein